MKKTRNYKEGYARGVVGPGGQGAEAAAACVCGKCKAESKAICLPVRLGAVRGQRMGDLVLVTSHMGPLST